MSEDADGRRARGARRRGQLIEATLRVVARDGVAGVTHRAVAAEAGVPKSAATYHFSSLDDLLVAALSLANEQTVAVLDAIPADGDLDALAAALTEFAVQRRDRIVAGFELYLLVARRPALRPAAQAWLHALGDAIDRHTGDPVRGRLAAAAVDGYFLQCLTTGADPDAVELAGLLRAASGPGS